MFTLSGGHLFVLYDGAVQADLRLVDTRHEQTATFAAEGWAKVTRRLGCAALTAGPGVTNGVSAMTAAGMNGTPMVVIGGRAPQARWGAGSLQELDHVPIVESVVKRASTATSGASIVAEIDAACIAARTPHRGPTFVDIPLDVFGPASVDIPAVDDAALRGSDPDPDAIKAVADARRRGRTTGDRRRRRRVLGPRRSCDGRVRRGGRRAGVRQRHGTRHDPRRSPAGVLARRGRSRCGRPISCIVAGTPLDFRLGFGRFGDAQVVHLCDAAAGVAPHAELAGAAGGDLAATFTMLTDAVTASARTKAWTERLRDEERSRRDAEARLARRRAQSDPPDPHLRRAARPPRSRRDRDR